MNKVFKFLNSLVTISLRRPADLRHVFGVANATAANNTVKAIAIFRRGGAIAWQGCAPKHRAVVRFFQQSGLNMQLVRGTAFAFAFLN
jgi:hypothetical protein